MYAISQTAAATAARSKRQERAERLMREEAASDSYAVWAEGNMIFAGTLAECRNRAANYNACRVSSYTRNGVVVDATARVVYLGN